MGLYQNTPYRYVMSSELLESEFELDSSEVWDSQADSFMSVESELASRFNEDDVVGSGCVRAIIVDVSLCSASELPEYELESQHRDLVAESEDDVVYALVDDDEELAGVERVLCGQTVKWVGDYLHDVVELTLEFETRVWNICLPVPDEDEYEESHLGQLIADAGGETWEISVLNNASVVLESVEPVSFLKGGVENREYRLYERGFYEFNSEEGFVPSFTTVVMLWAGLVVSGISLILTALASLWVVFDSVLWGLGFMAASVGLYFCFMKLAELIEDYQTAN